MAKTKYAEQRRDPRWQRRRLEILQRDNFSCQMCASEEKTLNVHHLYYISGREVWNYPDWALSTLCEECHVIQHEIAKDELQPFERLLELISGNESDLAHLYFHVDDMRAGSHMTQSEILSTLIEAAKSKCPKDCPF